MTESSGRSFWQEKSLAEMTVDEWEALCDGCGRCCLEKIEDEDTGEIVYTHVACRLFDIKTCRCSDYQNRHVRVPDCVVLTSRSVGTLDWLPPSCAYRLVAEGKELCWWHYLVSGDPETVHTAGISVRDIAIPGDNIDPGERERYVIEFFI
jgi:uncharacterized cysteine cluster protein YcgN (CxxCxxCC family)